MLTCKCNEPLRIWYILVVLAVSYYFCLLVSNGSSLADILFVLLIWAVANLPFAELRPSLVFAPSRSGFRLATGALVALVLRFALVPVGDDALIYLAPPLLGLILVLLCRPWRDLPRFQEILLILSLTPVLVWIPPLLPEAPLGEVTAYLANLLLVLGGFDAVQSGPLVELGGAVVRVDGPCSGRDMVAQAVLVALLARILIPLPKRSLRLPLLLLAPVLAWLANGLRIALLAWLASQDPSAAQARRGLFEFFHLGEGGLLFSGLAIGFFALIYSWLLNRQLNARQP